MLTIDTRYCRPAIAFFILLAGLSLIPGRAAHATPAKPASTCPGTDKACLLSLLDQDTAAIPETPWRDTTYRELAKLLAKQGQTEQAIALIAKIHDPDTQAMTIRGIGMAAAGVNLPKAQLDTMFAHLTIAANTITDPPSHAIALTYVAMSQAFAGDDDGATRTAHSMTNAELRNKAFNEAAKIQADHGRLPAAMASIAAIDDPGFRDKARRTVSKIRADNKDFDGALTMANQIGNPYQKAQAVLYILVKQISPEEVSVE